MAANISPLLAFVISPTDTAKAAVNAAIMPSLAASFLTKETGDRADDEESGYDRANSSYRSGNRLFFKSSNAKTAVAGELLLDGPVSPEEEGEVVCLGCGPESDQIVCVF